MTCRPRRWGWAVSGCTLLAAVLAADKLGLGTSTFGKLLDTREGIARYAHPTGQDLPRLLGLLGETLAMGVLGTILTLVLAIPLVPLAARCLTPHRAVYRLTREVLNFCRAMPDALLALMFIQALGLGPMAGVLALGVHSAGFMGKVLAESMERLPPSTWEGLQACGGSRLQLARFGGWPSIERELVGYALYMVDRNTRVATTLGIVGAGGIGIDLLSSIRTFNYGKASTVLLLIVGLVIAVDALSDQVRRRMA